MKNYIHFCKTGGGNIFFLAINCKREWSFICGANQE